MSDVRSSVEAAFEQVNNKAETQAAPMATPEAPSPAPAPEAKPASEAPPRARAPDGKFAKGAQPKPATEPPEEAPAAEPGEPKPEAQAAPTSTVKPPPSMRAAIREQWASLAPEVQQEVWRIEREHQKALQGAAEHRKTATALEKTLAPYRHFLGNDPMGAIQRLFQTAETLRTGDKEALLANLITANGVNVERLAKLLSGDAAPQQQAQQFRDTRVDELFKRLDQQQQAHRQRITEKVTKEVEAFRPQAEFFTDVREEMQLVLQRAAAKGEQPTIQQVYEAACLLNPEVRPLYLARTQAAATAKAATQQARAASASVRHEPTAPKGGNGAADRRSIIAAALAAQERR